MIQTKTTHFQSTLLVDVRLICMLPSILITPTGFNLGLKLNSHSIFRALIKQRNPRMEIRDLILFKTVMQKLFGLLDRFCSSSIQTKECQCTVLALRSQTVSLTPKSSKKGPSTFLPLTETFMTLRSKVSEAP